MAGPESLIYVVKILTAYWVDVLEKPGTDDIDPKSSLDDAGIVYLATAPLSQQLEQALPAKVRPTMFIADSTTIQVGKMIFWRNGKG